jgi:hypothetical protein
MMDWFNTRRSVAFGQEIAKEILGTLQASAGKRDHRFEKKAEKALVRIDTQVHRFCATERMNFYKRSKLANTFLWALKDGGCPEDYARELTDWLTRRL